MHGDSNALCLARNEEVVKAAHHSGVFSLPNTHFTNEVQEQYRRV